MSCVLNVASRKTDFLEVERLRFIYLAQGMVEMSLCTDLVPCRWSSIFGLDNVTEPSGP